MAKKAGTAAEVANAELAGQDTRSGQRLPALRPIRDRPTVEAIMDAVEGFDMSAARSDLKTLSSHMHFDGVELLPEGIFETGENEFIAVATVYAGLNFDSNEEAASTSDEFPAHVKGHFKRNGGAVVAVVKSFEMDTSSFYA